jgi:hypothetical protein
VSAPARAPLLALVLVAAVTALLCALGLAWQRDRHAVWERPGWSPRRFVLLDGGPESSKPAERHVVAVNPLCPHCVESLDEVVARRRAGDGRYVIAALIVDTPERPRWGVPMRLGEDETWWDSTGVWRRRWGHRVYGEVLVFDTDGTWVRTLPQTASLPPHLDVDPAKGLGVPPDDL